MIKFENISKEYPGQKYALKDFSVEIDDGEFVFLVGPSGAGKTTVLRLLLKDLLPTTGKIFVESKDIISLSKSKTYILRRNIGMVFQDFKLLEDRTIFENVAISLEIRGRKPSVINREVKEVLGLVGLTDKINMFPGQLSAGELQRSAIARAIAAGPKILLADEPTGNLDPATSWEILEILERINKLGTTIIMATHNFSIVNEISRRTIVLDKGKIASDEKKGKYPKFVRKGKK